MLKQKTIKIDIEVYSALIKKVQGFNETPNSVLRRVLNIDYPDSRKSDTRSMGVGRDMSKNIAGRIRGDSNRKALKNKYGSKIKDAPILYHAGWPLGADVIQKYSFGIPLRRFLEHKQKGGFLVFICGKVEQTLFIPCWWVWDNTKPIDETTTQLKFNIPVSEGLYYWMAKKDGVVVNRFKNRVPEKMV